MKYIFALGLFLRKSTAILQFSASSSSLRSGLSPSSSSVLKIRALIKSKVMYLSPELRKMAMRILALTTSSSAYEKNWSTFEMIHTTKRNRLTHKKLHDLIFLKFNAKLKNKHAVIDRNPLSADDDKEMVSEWLMGSKGDDSDDEVFPGECLTFRQVGDVSGANPRKRKSARMQAYKRKKRSGSSSSKGKEPVEDDEEEDIETSSASDEEDIPTLDFDED